MEKHPDIAIHSQNGEMIGLIQLLRRSDLNAELAAHIYGEHLRMGNLRGVRFLLLVTPAGLFLWDLEGGAPVGEVAARTLALPRFLQDRMKEPVTENIMLLATYEWLVHLAYQSHDPADPGELALNEAGFLPLLKSARFRFEPAA
jgi:hypothetical protein